MADLSSRPYADSYSGLVNQAIAACIVVSLAFGGHELMKRQRRGDRVPAQGLGSVETWGFGYLYQGRSWAKRPSPPSPQGWPLSWVKQALSFPEDKLAELRGVDAVFYIRFLRGCFWWVVLMTCTVFPVLFPIHFVYSSKELATTSLLRGGISSLVETVEGKKLLWVHLVMIYWVTITWMANVAWILRDTFRYRAKSIARLAEHSAHADEAEKSSQYHPHPHPAFNFMALPPLDHDGWTRGLRHRTVMVTNLPLNLRRSERELREYFEYWLARPLDVPSLGLPSSVRPGLINKLVALVYNRIKRRTSKIATSPLAVSPPVQHTVKGTQLARDAAEAAGNTEAGLDPQKEGPSAEPPQIDRVVIVRKMSELAALLHRREDVLVRLETAHITLARKVLDAVSEEMQARRRQRPGATAGVGIFLHRIRSKVPEIQIEEARDDDDDGVHGEGRMDLLVRTLGPFVREEERERARRKERPVPRGVGKSPLLPSAVFAFSRHGRGSSDGSDPAADAASPAFEPPPAAARDESPGTVWDALLSLPRSALEPYQPLIHLSRVWRGKTVPAIDYYTAKLNVLNSLILELRALDAAHIEPASTAFVTFKDPADARRACKYLAVHPNNPLACMVAMAPCYEDLDWGRMMKSTYRTEFVKDWVVGIGVWGFTIFWLLPVSALLTLVNLPNFEKLWPSLQNYFERHKRQSTLISNFLPTLLVSLLSILIPLILLLIAKKAHTIITLSELHDTIMTRYYKFLIVNVLVFFCVGVTVLESFFTKFHQTTQANGLLTIIQNAFPGAGPFYVGWLIFTTAMHGGFEIALFGLPLLVYPSTRRQITPRKRSVGIRPRTYNYYYWLPNHLLVLHILLLFSVLNPLVLPFGMIYFGVERTVVKNQLLHVYAKIYEGNAKLLVIRMVRYSFDGLMLAQTVFIAFMALEKKVVNIVLGAILLTLTLVAKLVATRLCRTRFDEDDAAEAAAVCGNVSAEQPLASRPGTPDDIPPLPEHEEDGEGTQLHPSFWTWRFPPASPGGVNFDYGPNAGRPPALVRQPMPFGSSRQPFTRLKSLELPKPDAGMQPETRATMSTPVLGGAMTYTGAAVGYSPLGPPPAVHHPEKQEPRKIVNSHPPHPAWDDESSPDQPYENPFLTRDIENVLWLPRDPRGMLDLDDTVDMHRSLTTAPGLGTLNQYDEGGLDDDDFGMLSMISSVGSIHEEDDPPQGLVPHVLSGGPIVHSPEILPAAAPVVGSPDTLPIEVRDAGDEGILAIPDPDRHVDRPSGPVTGTLSPRGLTIPASPHRHINLPENPMSPMSLRTPGPSSSPRRAATMATHGDQKRFRSISGSTQRSGHSAGRSSSRRSRRETRNSTDEHGVARRPTYHAQASFTRSALSIVDGASSHGGRSPSRGGRSPSRMSSRASRYAPSESGTLRLATHVRHATTGVSSHDAVVEEAIAEEREAAEEREQEELNEEDRAAQRPAWWKAWMFTNAEPGPEAAPDPAMA